MQQNCGADNATWITENHQYISYGRKQQVFSKTAVYLLSSELLHKQ